MSPDDLKKLEREISDHRDKADSLKRQAKKINEIMKNVPTVVIGKAGSYSDAGLDSSDKDGGYYSMGLANAAFRRVWDQHGPMLMKVVQSDLLQQAHQEKMTADLLQARLDLILAAAAAAGEEQTAAS